MSHFADLNGQSDRTDTAGLRHIRWLVRCLSLVAAILVLLAARQSRWPVLVPALSPFIAVGSLLATRVVVATACLGLGVGFIAMLRPRWFCRWICPLGLCVDTASRLGRRCGRNPAKRFSPGRWIVLLTLAGACLGYPLLLWLDPLAVFSGAFGITGSRTGWLMALPLFLVLTTSFVWPQIWCGRACPLGTFQDVLSHLARYARTKREGPSPERWNPALARRTVLGVAAGATLAAITRSSQSSGPRPLRPPGAIDEPEFRGLCVRCGNCIRACPTHIIEPSLGHHGLAALLTPVLHFKENYCLVDCTKCMAVCPSGALVRLSPQDKGLKPIGLPRVDMSSCLLAEGRECTECRRWCPHAAIRYAWSETEYTLIPEIDSRKCTGCGACEAACPTKPNKAILIAAMEKKAGG
ncbi:MAG TPA: 4Fe-4S dicluster domain-containing protein [Sedimentisphaerales bacterium]|nr:4Fe-4S dicluster domain-containing protein [Sedimentisphaerales bacterium]HRS09600.1 4Fe-4S dicluster domain-containing protein [Sedimentisphaerales bacterium]HRV46281.1 4Fe-4S dicluster domain-containing protein [Sedimentisphaerales bacterium]